MPLIIAIRFPGSQGANGNPNRAEIEALGMPSAAEFRQTLATTLHGASTQGLPYIDVIAGWLHEQVGEYPGPEHRMPVCCAVMRSEMRPGDLILDQPPKGVGASLTIRYFLPRP